MRGMWVLLLALGSPLGLVGAGFGLTCVGVAFGAFAPETWRQRLSLAPMGLGKRRRRAPKPHGVLTLPEGMPSWVEWARALPRSPRTTLLNQVQKARARTPYAITTRRGRLCLSLSLLRVVYQHQRRYYSPPRAALACWGRCLAMLMTTGMVDEIRRERDGALMAVCQTAIKGHTLRAQWFYQDARASTLLLWFAMLIVNVQRGIQMDCRHIDAGPSMSANVADLKTRFGFTSTTGWAAGYDGPFRTPLPCFQLDLDSMAPQAARQAAPTPPKVGSSGSSGSSGKRRKQSDKGVRAGTATAGERVGATSLHAAQRRARRQRPQREDRERANVVSSSPTLPSESEEAALRNRKPFLHFLSRLSRDCLVPPV